MSQTFKVIRHEKNKRTRLEEKHLLRQKSQAFALAAQVVNGATLRGAAGNPSQ